MFYYFKNDFFLEVKVIVQFKFSRFQWYMYTISNWDISLCLKAAHCLNIVGNIELIIIKSHTFFIFFPLIFLVALQ